MYKFNLNYFSMKLVKRKQKKEKKVNLERKGQLFF